MRSKVSNTVIGARITLMKAGVKLTTVQVAEQDLFWSGQATEVFDNQLLSCGPLSPNATASARIAGRTTPARPTRMSVVRSGTEAKIRVFESFGLAVATVFHFAIESRQVTRELSRVNP